MSQISHLQTELYRDKQAYDLYLKIRKNIYDDVVFTDVVFKALELLMTDSIVQMIKQHIKTAEFEFSIDDFLNDLMSSIGNRINRNLENTPPA